MAANMGSEALDRLEELLEKNMAALGRLEKMERMLLSTDPDHPGFALRLDRIEQMLRFVKWVGGGGLLGLAGTLVLLWQIVQAVTAAQGGG